MNLHPTDPQLDALLDQALAAGDVPGDLQDRVLALTDPAMNTLLDEALAADAAPEGLQTRVLAGIDRALDAQQPAVLATIGSRRPWLGYAAAAAVVLATGIAFYFIAWPAGNAPNTIAQNPDDHAADEATLAALEADTALDTEITTLQNRILTVSDEPIWGHDDDFQRELWQELSPDEESVAMLF